MKRGGGEQRRGAGELLAASSTFKEIFLFLFPSLFLSIFLFAPGAARGAAPPVPAKPSKYVTDNAGVLSSPAAARLNEKLAAFERATSNQVLFWIDRRVPEGTTLEEFTNRCFHEWGVGQKGKSNGVAFFLFTDERKMRMEVGYGLEGALPDARAHRIDSEIIAPLLKAGDKGTGRTAAEARRQNPSAIWFFLPLLVPFILVAIVLAVAAYMRRRGPGRPGPGTAWSSSDSSWSSSSSSSSDSSSSDSSSSSDFSGGGGDSGGGGSSDSY